MISLKFCANFKPSNWPLIINISSVYHLGDKIFLKIPYGNMEIVYNMKLTIKRRIRKWIVSQNLYNILGLAVEKTCRLAYINAYIIFPEANYNHNTSFCRESCDRLLWTDMCSDWIAFEVLQIQWDNVPIFPECVLISRTNK